MHSYIVRLLVGTTTYTITINAGSASQARSEALSKYKDALILSIKCIDYDNDTRMY